MKLYSYAVAPNPRRIGLFMKYKGIEIPTEEIDLTKGEHHGDVYRAINPRCTVPALVLEDGSVLSDTIAILLYVESLYPEKPLMGATALEQAKIVGWCHRIFVEGLSAIADILRNKNDHFKDSALPGNLKIPQISELVNRGHLRIRDFLVTMDHELASGGYLSGKNLSQADIDLYALIGFCGWVKLGIPDDCQNLQSWFQRIKSELGE